MSKHAEKYYLVTDLEVVLDRQVLIGIAFGHDVLQHSCS